MGRISMPQGKGSQLHNRREYEKIGKPIPDNIDSSKTVENITLVDRDIRQIYQEIFGDALEQYNSKQKRADRRIHSYYEHIAKSKNGEKLFYEDVLQWGKKEDFKNPQTRERAKEALVRYVRTFEQRNPNLRLIGAYIHMDEASPHLHLDYVPVAHGYSRGLSTRNSLDKAMKEMGFVPEKESRKNNATKLWKESERAVFGQICRGIGLEVEQERKSDRKNLTVDEYKEARDEMLGDIEREYKFLKLKAEDERKSLSDAQKAVKFEKKALDDIKVQSDKIIAEFDVLTGHKEEYEKSVAIITDLENQEKELEDVKPVLFNKQKMLVSKDLFERMKELIKSLRKAIKRIVAFNIELMKENDDLIDELKGFKSKEKYGRYLTNDEIDLNRYEKYQMQNQIEELEEENKNFSKYLELNGLDSDEIEWIKNPKMAKMALLEEEEEEEFF